jgi:hypothetical protein
MSLRLKIAFALLISSLIAALGVGLIARWMVTRHLSEVTVSTAFNNFQDDMVAFYQTYDSWEEAFRREHFTAFVVRRRGDFTVDSRTPLKPVEIDKPVIEDNPTPLPAASPATAQPRETPQNLTPPVRFVLIDPQGKVLHPVERSGEQIAGNWRAEAMPVRSDQKIIAYALPQGEVQFNSQERAYLTALNIALVYAAAITLPIMIIIGLLWGHRLIDELDENHDALARQLKTVLDQYDYDALHRLAGA